MAMFGSSWNEDDKPIGPMSHWLEDEEIDYDGPLELRSIKEIVDDDNDDFDKRVGPMSSWSLKNYNKHK